MLAVLYNRTIVLVLCFQAGKEGKRLVRWLGVITPEYTEPVFFHLLRKKCIEINLWRQYQMKKKTD